MTDIELTEMPWAIICPVDRETGTRLMFYVKNFDFTPREGLRGTLTHPNGKRYRIYGRADNEGRFNDTEAEEIKENAV